MPRQPKAEFREAPDVEEIARSLIAKSHGHLTNARIKYLKRYGKWQTKGRLKLGAVEKVSDKHKIITELDFIVIINGTVYDAADTSYREGVIDHYICYLGMNDKDEYCTWTHDWEGFIANIRRHGLWMNELKRIADAAVESTRQLTLYDVAPEHIEETGAPAPAEVN
jgi:hypothetical protein